MAAVLLLVFLPVIFAVMFMMGTIGGHLTFINMLGVLMFIALCTGLLVGMMRLSSKWDHPRGHPS